MTRNITLQLPDTTSLKTEEIDFVTKLATKVAGNGSYFSQFLNPATVRWFNSQVASDFDCDLYQWYEDANKRVIELVEENNILTRKLATAEQRYAALSQDYDILTNNMEKNLNKIADLESENRTIKDVHEQDVELYRNVSLINDSKNATIQALKESLLKNGECADLRQEVLTLKARLFDLLDK